MSAPISSFEMDSLDTKTAKVATGDRLLGKDSEDSNTLKEIEPATVKSYVYTLSDEDSPLAVGIVHISETALLQKNINEVTLTLKNAPAGSVIEVDAELETGENTNVFATIFSTKPTIDTGEFSSKTAAIPPVISTLLWPVGRRMQFRITLVDSGFAASGLKVEIR